MNPIKRIENVEIDNFVRDHVTGNSPVIVTDGMDRWPARGKWTLAFFCSNFGDLDTPIYDDLFTLRDVLPLRDYVSLALNRTDHEFSHTYARWYVKIKEVEFDWADAVFDSIMNDWSHPYFLPTSSYVLPLCRPPSKVFVNRDAFPYKGLLISPRGSRTRLHRDPFGTDALLCQFYGSKRILFYHPNDRHKLMRGNKFLDPQCPDRKIFPECCDAKPVLKDILRPGEILFIPSGWFHDVLSITDSISVTWNFVHSANRSPFLQELSKPENDFDRDMLQFFFGRTGTLELTTADIARVARSVEERPHAGCR